jgi:hypothetical protein
LSFATNTNNLLYWLYCHAVPSLKRVFLSSNIKRNGFLNKKYINSSNFSLSQNNNLPLNNGKWKLIIDNSKTKNIVDRQNGLYKVYSNVYLKINFIENLTDILEDFYDNYAFSNFRLHFIYKGKIRQYDYLHLINHLSQYSVDLMNNKDIKTRIFKNVGLIFACEVFVFFPTYDLTNLKNIATSLKSIIHDSIKLINKNVYKDLGNSVVNFNNKIDYNDELCLVISVNFNNEEFNSFKSRMKTNFSPSTSQSESQSGSKIGSQSELQSGKGSRFSLNDSIANQQSIKHSLSGFLGKRVTKSIFFRHIDRIIDRINLLNSRSYSNLSFSSYKNIKKDYKPTLNKLTNPNSYAYNSENHIFSKLVLFLNNFPLNEDTQLKMEKFLLDQSLELAKATQENQTSDHSIERNIPNSIGRVLFENKLLLEKLINNLKINLEIDSNDPLFNKILINSDVVFLISITLG